MKRGQLSPEIIAKAREFFGYDINRTELRLLPYIHSVSVNDQVIDPRRVNDEEIAILRKWDIDGHLLLSPSSTLEITKPFYDAINEILWIAYVDYENRPDL
jgi:hypothetical protein